MWNSKEVETEEKKGICPTKKKKKKRRETRESDRQRERVCVYVYVCACLCERNKTFYGQMWKLDRLEDCLQYDASQKSRGGIFKRGCGWMDGHLGESRDTKEREGRNEGERDGDVGQQVFCQTEMVCLTERSNRPNRIGQTIRPVCHLCTHAPHSHATEAMHV